MMIAYHIFPRSFLLANEVTLVKILTRFSSVSFILRSNSEFCYVLINFNGLKVHLNPFQWFAYSDTLIAVMRSFPSLICKKKNNNKKTRKTIKSNFAMIPGALSDRITSPRDSSLAPIYPQLPSDPAPTLVKHFEGGCLLLAYRILMGWSVCVF